MFEGEAETAFGRIRDQVFIAILPILVNKIVNLHEIRESASAFCSVLKTKIS